jgi:hypothetical protein
VPPRFAARGSRQGGKLKGIWVTVRNFEAYKGRKDVTHNSWFRCSNRLLEDPDFYDFSHAEILVWVYILSLVSQKNNATVFLNFDRADRICRLKTKDVESAIQKLYENQLVPGDVTSTLRARDGDVTSTCATDRQTDRQTASALHEIGEVWNENCAPLPKIKEWNKKRDQLVKNLPANFDGAQMLELTKRVTASDFLTGKIKKWRASFEWVLKKRVEILEGNYDNSGTERMRVVL